MKVWARASLSCKGGGRTPEWVQVGRTRVVCIKAPTRGPSVSSSYVASWSQVAWAVVGLSVCSLVGGGADNWGWDTDTHASS